MSSTAMPSGVERGLVAGARRVDRSQVDEGARVVGQEDPALQCVGHRAAGVLGVAARL